MASRFCDPIAAQAGWKSNDWAATDQSRTHKIGMKKLEQGGQSAPGKNAKGRTTCPLFSEHPASSPLSRDFALTLQIALPIGTIVVQLVKT